MDSLEGLLDEGQLQFWRESVPLAAKGIAAEEPQRAEVMMAAERTTAAADAGNIPVSRHEEVDLDGGLGAVAEAAMQHGVEKRLAAAGANVSLQEEQEEEQGEGRAAEKCSKCGTSAPRLFGLRCSWEEAQLLLEVQRLLVAST
jgi:hypothetical protein